MALIHLELSEHVACKMAFQRLLQYLKISSFRKSSGAGAACWCYEFYPAAVIGERGEDVAATARPTTLDDDEALWRQREVRRPSNRLVADSNHDGPDEEDHHDQEEGRTTRMHMWIDRVVKEIILNATHVQWNAMLGPAAAA